MLPRFRFLALLVAIPAFCLSILGKQQAAAPKLQTARQALIEMIIKGGDEIQKHLTVEVQGLLKSSGKANPLGMYMSAFKVGSGTETFDSGDVLLAYSDPANKLKYELHVDSDDLAGDEDTLLLSIHIFGDGKEQEDSWALLSSHFSVSMKLQQNVWRLNKVSVGAEFPIGDPNFVQKILFNTGAGSTANAGFYTPLAHTEIQLDSTSDQHLPPTMSPEQVVTLLGYAETTFARMHPEAGFTCSSSDLAETAKMMGVDTQVIGGVYNGYRFALSGCEGKPAGSFQFTAEPVVVKPGTKAFCTDATQNVRESEDGHGATCIVSGKVHQASEDGPVAIQLDFHASDTETKPKQ